MTGYLKSEGLSVGEVTANHQTLAVSGTAAQVEKAFDVSLGTYRPTQSFFANAAAPSLPAGVAAEISSVAGLDTRRSTRTRCSRRRAADRTPAPR